MITIHTKTDIHPMYHDWDIRVMDYHLLRSEYLDTRIKSHAVILVIGEECKVLKSRHRDTDSTIYPLTQLHEVIEKEKQHGE